jgi:glyoxylase-like metal-dependent hydrolase (beta-lactamase superfamily II)
MNIPDGVELVLAPNPGRMTLAGTNTWVVPLESQPLSRNRRIAVVDPGPLMPAHLDHIRDAGRIEGIFLTHHHLDHSEAADLLSREFDAPVFAQRDGLATGGSGLVDGQRIRLGPAEFEVLHTPGHTYDSICLHLKIASSSSAVLFTGDTLLGGSATMISRPDGDLAEYLSTLDRLSSSSDVVGLPGHGAVIPVVAEWATEMRARRERRLAMVLEQWRLIVEQDSNRSLSERVTSTAEAVYGTEGGVVPEFFERMVIAHLRYLSSRGMTGEERF